MGSKSRVSEKSGMVVTDLDGTLLHRNSTISQTDIATLKMLKKKKILRVIATGRNLLSASRALDVDLPIDFMIFSSGAGIVEWDTKGIIRKQTMSRDEVEIAVQLLLRMNIDFMIHSPIPQNHRFTYYGTGENNPDFIRRLELYWDFATPGNRTEPSFDEACQIIVIEPHDGDNATYRYLQRKLSSLKVIRTTSPIDGRSTWIELFPSSVSKSRAAEWLSIHCNVNQRNICAIGNDYNDLDLLSWAPISFLVENAPDDLKAHFQNVRSSRENGFTDAIVKWLDEMNL